MSNRPLKLFLCITKSNWGGAQKYVYDVATGLPRDAFIVTVLLGGAGELKTKLEAAGIRTIMLPNSERDIHIGKEWKLFFDLYRIFKKEKPDIIHLNSSKLGGTGALAGRFAGIKRIIFTGHGWAFNENRPWYQKIIIKWLHYITILLAHKTIAVSRVTKRQIPWPIRTKLTVIYNGLRPIPFKDTESARAFLIEKIGAKNTKANATFARKPIWIGTISELHTNKGLIYAIEAIAMIPENIVFVIIGEGEERKKLEEHIIKLGVSQKVFLVGRVEMAGEYLKSFDVFTLTSITEAFPYVLLETGSAHLPIIASEVGGIPEIIENEKTGMLVRPRQTDEIRKALIQLIKTPALRTELGNNLGKEVASRFQLAEMLRRTIAVYRI